MKVVICILMVLCPMAASAQTVFFDDFDGNALQPHWIQPPPSRWEYNVSGGMLNVTDLYYPGVAHLRGNFAAMGALFAPQTDFRMDVWMGWDEGGGPRRLVLRVMGGQTASSIIGSFGYSDVGNLGATPAILAGAFPSPNLLLMPAPLSGMQHFAITRVGTTFDFYFNGSLFGSLAGSTIPATGIVLDFLGPYPGEIGDFYIDRVAVTPAPGLLSFTLPLALACACDRTRRTVTTSQGDLR